MCPLVRNLGTYVKDTNHAVRIFNDFHFDNTTTGERFLYTMDIKSLYTVIPNNSGLEALAYFLNKRPVLDPPTSTLTRLAELMMTLNAFTFNGDFYQQIGGVAMGSKMGPNYASIFVGYVEERIASQYHGFVPQLHKRYIDDVIGIACCSRVDLENYIRFVSNFHPALQFTHTISDTELSFLDITLRITDDHINTTIYYKDTDTHTYLHHQPLQKRSSSQSTLATSPSVFWRLRFSGKGRWNGVFLWTTWILHRLFTERSPGHPTVRPGWCTKQSQPL